ncbi:MAG: hypothetical protein ABSC63_16925 [Candidatus Binataceae bacterium]|jgi:hypothetical protein
MDVSFGLLDGSAFAAWIGDAALGIGVDSSGHVALVGYTTSRDYPVTSNALENRCLACGVPNGGNALIAEFTFP